MEDPNPKTGNVYSKSFVPVGEISRGRRPKIDFSGVGGPPHGRNAGVPRGGANFGMPSRGMQQKPWMFRPPKGHNYANMPPPSGQFTTYAKNFEFNIPMSSSSAFSMSMGSMTRHGGATEVTVKQPPSVSPVENTKGGFGRGRRGPPAKALAASSTSASNVLVQPKVDDTTDKPQIAASTKNPMIEMVQSDIEKAMPTEDKVKPVVEIAKETKMPADVQATDSIGMPPFVETASSTTTPPPVVIEPSTVTPPSVETQSSVEAQPAVEKSAAVKSVASTGTDSTTALKFEKTMEMGNFKTFVSMSNMPFDGVIHTPEKWSDIDFPIELEGRVAKLGYIGPQPIQSLIIPMCKKGHDVIFQSVIDSGKLTTIVLSILSGLSDYAISKSPPAKTDNGDVVRPRAIIISPSGLAVAHAFEHCRRIIGDLNFSVATVSSLARDGDCDILCSTLEELKGAKGTKQGSRIVFDKLRILAVEQIERLEENFLNLVRFVRGTKGFPKDGDRQTILTGTSISEKVQELAAFMIKPDYCFVRLKRVVPEKRRCYSKSEMIQIRRHDVAEKQKSTENVVSKKPKEKNALSEADDDNVPVTRGDLRRLHDNIRRDIIEFLGNLGLPKNID